MHRLSILFITLLLLAACSSNPNQALEDQPISENPLLPLSTSNDQTDHTDQTDQTIEEEPSPEVVNLDEDTTTSPGFGIPQEEPSQQDPIEPTAVSEDFRLPLENFKERWNALSTEQGSNLQIVSFVKTDKGFYYSSLRDELELMVIPNNKQIQRALLFSKSTSTSGVSSMLAGWSQIVYMFDPGVNPHQIDELFTEIGVGPNFDLSKIEEKSVDLSETRYTLKKLENGLQFEASYQED